MGCGTSSPVPGAPGADSGAAAVVARVGSEVEVRDFSTQPAGSPTPGPLVQPEAIGPGAEAQKSAHVERAITTIAAAVVYNEVSAGDAYEAFDVDEDGKLSRLDLLHAVKTLRLGLSEGDVRTLFEELDPDQQGYISEETWIEGVSAADVRDVLRSRGVPIGRQSRFISLNIRIAKNRMRSSFEAWRQCSIDHLACACGHLAFDSLMAAFAGWKNLASENTRRQASALTVMRRVAHGSLTISFERWLKNAADERAEGREQEFLKLEELLAEARRENKARQRQFRACQKQMDILRRDLAVRRNAHEAVEHELCASYAELKFLREEKNVFRQALLQDVPASFVSEWFVRQVPLLQANKDVTALVQGMSMHQGSLPVQEAACEALLALTPSAEGQEFKSLYSDEAAWSTMLAAYKDLATRGVIHSLVQAMTTHSNTSLVVTVCACRILRLLARLDSNRQAIAEQGGIGAVVLAMRSQRRVAPVQEQGCRALAMLAFSDDNRQAIVAKHGIEVVVAALSRHRASADVTQYACAALVNLSNSAAHRAAVAAKDGIAAVVGAIVAQQANADVQRWGLRFVCVCVCVCVYLYRHIHTYIYTYIHEPGRYDISPSTATRISWR